jgi:hypothetical protein
MNTILEIEMSTLCASEMEELNRMYLEDGALLPWPTYLVSRSGLEVEVPTDNLSDAELDAKAWLLSIRIYQDTAHLKALRDLFRDGSRATSLSPYAAYQRRPRVGEDGFTDSLPSVLRTIKVPVTGENGRLLVPHDLELGTSESAAANASD